jgi:hypothetical protein
MCTRCIFEVRIVVNHLTRMKAPRICAAGLDRAGGRHIRPTTHPDPLTRSVLASEGGPFALGTLVELGDTTPCPNPPETEDHRFSPTQAQVLGQLSPDRYLELLREHARDGLHALFGQQLERRGRSYAVEAGLGTASLGILRTRGKAKKVYINAFGSLRLELTGSDPPASLPVNDLRLFEPDHETVSAKAVADLNARMSRTNDILLMVGLTRPYLASGDDRKRHWLQINGICMADRPLGGQP